MNSVPDNVVAEAIRLFRYREAAMGKSLPCDSDWSRVMNDAVRPALHGVRGETDQQQCAYQAIRLNYWPASQKPWTKAFLASAETLALPTPATLPTPWYQRWWTKVAAWSHSFLKRFNDFL